MKAWYLVFALLLTCGMGCHAVLDVGSKGEKEIPLSDVPAAAFQAARGAVDGITLTEAEMEKEDGQMIYDIEGTADGTAYEIEVTADGKVLEVEKKGQAADDDEQDEDEDDD